MKCDKLKSYTYDDMIDGDADTNIEYYPKSDADAAIAELEAENVQLKKETEFMHSNCKWDAGDGCARLLGEKLAIIDEIVELKHKLSEKDAEIESFKASHYAEMVDAGMRERRLRRALWIARALRARDIQRWWISATCAPITERACSVWNNVERKCRAKAEQYK